MSKNPPTKAECDNSIIDIETLAGLYDSRLLERAATIRAYIAHLESVPPDASGVADGKLRCPECGDDGVGINAMEPCMTCGRTKPDCSTTPAKMVDDSAPNDVTGNTPVAHPGSTPGSGQDDPVDVGHLAEKLLPLVEEMYDELCGHGFIESLCDEIVIARIIARYLIENGAWPDIRLAHDSPCPDYVFAYKWEMVEAADKRKEMLGE